MTSALESPGQAAHYQWAVFDARRRNGYWAFLLGGCTTCDELLVALGNHPRLATIAANGGHQRLYVAKVCEDPHRPITAVGQRFKVAEMYVLMWDVAGKQWARGEAVRLPDDNLIETIGALA